MNPKNKSKGVEAEVLLVNPWTDHYRIRYVLPPGWEPVAIPEDTAVANEFAAFKVQWRRQGRDVLVETIRTLKKQRVPISGYKEFRDLAGKLDSAESQLLLVRPAGGEEGIR